MSAFDSSWVKSDGKLEIFTRGKSSNFLPEVDGVPRTLQEPVGRGKRGGAMSNVGEGNGTRDDQAVDHVAKVQVVLR